VTLGAIPVLADGPRPASPEETARRFAAEHPGQLGLDRLALATGRAEIRQHLSQRFVRLEVLRQGLPVFFSSVVIQVDAEGRIRRTVAHLPRASVVVDEHPADCLDAARRWAEDHHLEPGDPVAGWLETRDGALTPVVRIDVRAAGEALPTAIYLDARSSQVAHAEPLVDQFEPPAAVYVENPVTTPQPLIVHLADLDDLRLQRLNGRYARVEQCVDVVDCAQTAPGASPDIRGHFLFGPDLAPYSFHDPFAEVNAYHNISAISRWARESFGWNGEFDGHTWIWVKVGLAVYNAYFFQGSGDIPPQITFGQDTIDFAYDADVAFHEFGHAINRSSWSHPWYFADRFGMDTSPFGIEEGLADIWAETHAGDPVMNAYVTRARTADNDLTCPADLHAEGHMEARIVSGFGWDVRERVGREAWDHTVYRALLLLEPQAAFDDLVHALLLAAEDLAAEGEVAIPEEMSAVLLEEAEARGLLSSACIDRFVPLPEGEPYGVYGYGRDRTYGHDFPFGLQWKITAPPDGVAFKLFFEWAYPEDEDPGFRVHLSRGRPVEVSWHPIGDLADGEPAFDVLADATFRGAPEQLSFPYLGLEPLAPGEEVYVLLSGDVDAPIVLLTGEVRFLDALPPPPGRPLGGPLEGGPSTAASWSPSCGAAPAGRKRDGPTGLLGLLGALFD